MVVLLDPVTHDGYTAESRLERHKCDMVCADRLGRDFDLDTRPNSLGSNLAFSPLPYWPFPIRHPPRRIHLRRPSLL